MRYKWIIIMVLIISLTGCITYDPETLNLELKAGIDTVEVHSDFVDAGARATIGEGVTYRYKVIENTVDITTVGTYYVLYEATYQGLSRTLKRMVNVIDETPPDITLNPGIDTLRVGEPWMDAGVTVTDNSLLPVDVHVDGEVNHDMAGEYQVTYKATDAFGNQAIIIRYVSVLPK